MTFWNSFPYKSIRHLYAQKYQRIKVGRRNQKCYGWTLLRLALTLYCSTNLEADKPLISLTGVHPSYETHP